MMLPTSPAAYLRSDFIRSFEKEVHPGNWNPESDNGAFAITQLCLTYWNAAAGLYFVKARAGSTETTRFIGDRLAATAAPFGARYRSRASILYALFRHGLVHQRIPGELKGKAATVSWVIGRDLADADHLMLVGPLARGESRKCFGLTLDHILNPVPRSFIGLKPDCLYEHSLLAFHALANECERDKALADRVREGIRQAKLPRQPAGSEICAMIDAALSSPDPWPPQLASGTA